VGDLSRLRLRVALPECGDVGVHRRVEKILEVVTALFPVGVLGPVEEHVRVEADEPVVYVLAHDGRGQRLLGRPVADVLSDLHPVFPRGTKPFNRPERERQPACRPDGRFQHSLRR